MIFLYRIRQLMLRLEINERLSSLEATDTLCLSLDQYYRNKVHKHEISLDGKMYDIKSFEISGDEVVLEVIRDIHEENILHRVLHLLTHSHKPVKTWPGVIGKIMSLHYLIPDFQLINLNYIKTKLKFNFCDSLYQLVLIDTPCPPPWLLSIKFL